MASSFNTRFGNERRRKKKLTTNKTVFLFCSLLLVSMLRVWDFRICFETAVVNRVLFSVATCCYRKRTSLNCSTLNGFCFRCKSIFHIWIQLMIYFFNEVHWIPLDENNIVTIPIRTLQFNMPKSYAIFKHSSVHLFRQFQVFVLPALENLNFPIKKIIPNDTKGRYSKELPLEIHPWKIIANNSVQHH